MVTRVVPSGKTRCARANASRERRPTELWPSEALLCVMISYVQIDCIALVLLGSRGAIGPDIRIITAATRKPPRPAAHQMSLSPTGNGCNHPLFSSTQSMTDIRSMGSESIQALLDQGVMPEWVNPWIVTKSHCDRNGISI